jgi:eukaryotic-like serine/threonine-protein kinase
MAFSAGTKLGSYEIVGQLGVGGMGEVYRARDTRLKRDVAIKVLPDQFSRDADRVARFQREAEILASLNHSHIAAIHHLEEVADSRLLILELVEGETLAERIYRGPLPVDDSIEIAKQIAEALSVAHEKGIVHRDLKPANVKITPDGKVKVLDFGLAKVYEAESNAENLSHSPTIMSGRTGGGVILGTISYMSPEQARGRPVTKQTDIWAFGCVLFEMLTGRMAFSGETVSDTIAKILKEDPDWTALGPAVPVQLRRLIQRCLQKDLQRRFHDAGDVRSDLIEVEDMLAGRIAMPHDIALPTSRRTAVARPIAIFAAALIVVLTFAMIWLARDRTPSIPTWAGTQLGGPSLAWGLALSPDARFVAFEAMVDGVTQVAVMNPDSGDWRVLTHDRTHGYLSNVTWSPDSSRIYYGRVDGAPKGVFSVSALGGDERLVLEGAKFPEALPDGSLLAVRVNDARQSQIHRFWPETGRLQPYPWSYDSTIECAMRAFPDGKEAIFWGQPLDQPASDTNLYNLDLTSGRAIKIDTGVQQTSETGTIGLGVDRTGSSILTAKRSGDLTTIVAIPRHGGIARPLMTMPNRVRCIEGGANGEIYIDQLNRPLQVLRLTNAAAPPQRLLTSNVAWIDPLYGASKSGSLPDGRILITNLVGGHRRLMAANAGQDPIPFVQTMEESSGPVTLVSNTEVAFVIGAGTSRKIAIAAASDGRVIRRLDKIDAAAIYELASDGKTLYYGAAGKIWAVASNGDGQARMIRDGDGFALDPRGNSLIVQLNETDSVRLVRVPLGGGEETMLNFPGVRLAEAPIAANAIRPDGAIIKSLAVSSWYWAPAILHPDTGKVDRISLPSLLDVHYPTWTADGRILLFGFLDEGTLWRFKPEPAVR